MAAATMEGTDRVMATAQQILKSLNNTSKGATEDMMMIFSTFDNRLSNITAEFKVDSRFEDAEELIFNANSSRHSLPWEHDAADYLAAVDQILQLTENLTIQPDTDLADRAESALQLAMLRLEEEFRHVLIRNTMPLDSDRLYGFIRKVEEFEEDPNDEVSLRLGHQRNVSLGDELNVELIHPDAVEELKEIADRMIRSGYEKECCQVYSTVRRDVLDECMSILCLERLSIEEVQKIEWRNLDEKMKKWTQALKIVVRVLLSGEKRLCQQIFGGSDLIEEVCFVETAKGCVIQLLSFGEAVVIGKRSPEKLFGILDMYDVLVDVLPDLKGLFRDESGESMCSEAQGVLCGLGEAAIGTFVEFENAVKAETSRKPIQGCEIHPLTRYVMNYVKLLVDYSESLNGLLPNNGEELFTSQNDDGKLESVSPISTRLLSLLTTLELNLKGKSRLYEDSAMQYIFMMNNILYIVQKVKDSDLRNLIGDQWIRKRRGQIRQYATSYLRASWSKVLSCLKDQGIGGSTGNASKMALKERFKNFNACFEDLYSIQTGWKVPDAQLREELRISISEKVIPAYRSFMGRFRSQLESARHSGKYIKYTPEDLENYLLDLFEGRPAVLNHMRRKSA